MEASTRDYKCKKKGRKGDRDSNYKGWEKEKSSEYPLEVVLQEVGTKNRPGATNTRTVQIRVVNSCRSLLPFYFNR